MGKAKRRKLKNCATQAAKGQIETKTRKELDLYLDRLKKKSKKTDTIQTQDDLQEMATSSQNASQTRALFLSKDANASFTIAKSEKSDQLQTTNSTSITWEEKLLKITGISKNILKKLCFKEMPKSRSEHEKYVIQCDLEKSNPILEAMIQMIKMAETNIHIHQANLNDPSILQALKEALKNKKDLKCHILLTKGENTSHEKLLGGSNFQIFRELSQWAKENSVAQNRLDLRWITNELGQMPDFDTSLGMSHMKYMSIDDKMAKLGSSNMDIQSTYFSAENAFVLEDETVVRDTNKGFFEQYFSRAEPFDALEHEESRLRLPFEGKKALESLDLDQLRIECKDALAATFISQSSNQKINQARLEIFFDFLYHVDEFLLVDEDLEHQSTLATKIQDFITELKKCNNEKARILCRNLQCYCKKVDNFRKENQLKALFSEIKIDQALQTSAYSILKEFSEKLSR